MKLENYISDLLYRYECVIVPEFGGFITSEIGSKIDYNNHHFYPPYKKLSFNAYLKNNDGLLVNYIASVDQISFEEASNWIKDSLLIWNEKINNNQLHLANIGTFERNAEGKLQFEPDLVENYLTTSFGLSTVLSEAIEREVVSRVQKKSIVKQSPEKVIEVELPKVAAISLTEKTKKPNFILRTLPKVTKYAAAASIAVALFGLANNYYQQKLQEEFIVATQQYQQKTEKNIQEATFVISNPLPAITLHLEREAKNFHVIAGAFRSEENAERKVTQLKQLGYDARIVEVNKWSLTQVAFGSYATMEEATAVLTKVLNTQNDEAWVLVTNN
jgi:hypothetical protein